MRLRIDLPIAMIALLLLAAPAGATMTYYTSQAAWAAATSDVFTVHFNDVVVPASPGYVDYSVTGVQLHDVSFTAIPATADGIQVGNLPTWCYANAFGAGNYFLCGNTYGAKYFEAALPPEVVGVGMRLLPVPFSNSVSFAFSSGDTQVVPALASASPVFVGFIFDQPISWVRFESANANSIAVDDFSYASTPEASTLLLAGAGLFSLLVAKRLRRRC